MYCSGCKESCGVAIDPTAAEIYSWCCDAPIMRNKDDDGELHDLIDIREWAEEKACVEADRRRDDEREAR